MRKRQNILNLASNKYVHFKSLISELKCNTNNNIRNLLVYCHDSNQLNKINAILNDEEIIKHKFTGEENIEERLNLLNHFSNGDIHALVAMKCLDEGVDVPRSELAIFCASTGNPRQFIQRRGRVLRTHKDKRFAIIHDLIVIPDNVFDEECYSLEKSLVESELRRVRDFALLSENLNDTDNELQEVLNHYNLSIFN